MHRHTQGKAVLKRGVFFEGIFFLNQNHKSIFLILYDDVLVIEYTDSEHAYICYPACRKTVKGKIYTPYPGYLFKKRRCLLKASNHNSNPSDSLHQISQRRQTCTLQLWTSYLLVMILRLIKWYHPSPLSPTFFHHEFVKKSGLSRLGA